MIVQTRNTVIDYVLEAEREFASSQQTVFEFSAPHPRWAEKIEDWMIAHAEELKNFFGRASKVEDTGDVAADVAALPITELAAVKPFVDLVVTATLRGWRNMKGDDGSEIKWHEGVNDDAGRMDPALLQLLPLFGPRLELFNQGMQFIGITEADRKN